MLSFAYLSVDFFWGVCAFDYFIAMSCAEPHENLTLSWNVYMTVWIYILIALGRAWHMLLST